MAEIRHKSSTFPIVAIGASAGGLEACTKLVSAIPSNADMAFVLVQHLDPHHKSLMVDLLAAHTTMVVVEAADGIMIAPGHFYVIAPGTYLGIEGGALKVTRPNAPHGARFPFNYLLKSLSE